MSLIRDIKQQPRSLRVVMFGLSIITTLSLVGLIWVNSVQKDLYALLNTPTPDANADQLADEEDDVRSPLAFVKDAFQGTANSIFGLLSRGPKESPSAAPQATRTPRPFIFPISDPR
jgi:hypothetical protein